MAEVVVFPDAELVVVNWLRTELAARGYNIPVSTRVPQPRPDRFVRVERLGGVRLNLVADDPMIVVECWGPSDALGPQYASDLAQLARGLVHAMPGAPHSGVFVHRVTEVGGPAHLPDPLSDQPRYLFTVTVAMRGVAV